MSARADFDIVIAGGGMVGASLALALAGLPLRTLVIEATPPADAAQPSYDDRATALAESSRRILEGIGCWAELAPAAAPIREVHVSERGAFGVTRLRAVEHGLASFGHVVENRALGQALWRRLKLQAGVSVRVPARVTGLAQDEGGVTVTVDAGDGGTTAVRARLLVAADGARSPTRTLAGIEHETRDYHQVAVIANLSPAEDHGGTAFERFTSSGPLAVLPLARGRVTIVWTLPPERAATVAALDDDAFLAELQRAFGYRLGVLRKVGRRASYPLSLVQARAWHAGRVVLAGNAAHGIHPVAGQGFNLGLRDAAALAELVARHPADPGQAAVLEEYAEWREADRARTVRDTDSLVQVFTSELATLRAGRRLGLVGLDLLRPARAMVARRGMGLAGRLPRLALGRSLGP
ncbi:2-octaprenyl-6-methoxyphenyl hydroxylase [Thioalkalivibrio sp. XN279]|uniref:2-octaprenyl-6-methoxyphenyl hydroxylase n=1 Tax=Thioalkalivibrio sp. XN279 TaxID=2714953 RepID=UPI0014074B54|nr:2-octaprenyl-6-methoxyphenyl hydroxylase [Thioalkalivibrio sp. XN279]NHA15139.1 2-octaprenyl-6-methoxyphenyl hydroxylase [Thioalkalivibrio sp. XN279]